MTNLRVGLLRPANNLKQDTDRIQPGNNQEIVKIKQSRPVHVTRRWRGCVKNVTTPPPAPPAPAPAQVKIGQELPLRAIKLEGMAPYGPPIRALWAPGWWPLATLRALSVKLILT